MSAGKLQRAHLLCLEIEEGALPRQHFFRRVEPNVTDKEHIARVRVILRVIAVDTVIAIVDLNIVFGYGHAALESRVAVGGYRYGHVAKAPELRKGTGRKG